MVGDREPIAQLIPAVRAEAAASSPAAERDWALDRLEQFHADGNRLSDVDGARMLVALEPIGTPAALGEDLSRGNPPSPLSPGTDLHPHPPHPVPHAPAPHPPT